jgi:hypothetical protein
MDSPEFGDLQNHIAKSNSEKMKEVASEKMEALKTAIEKQLAAQTGDYARVPREQRAFNLMGDISTELDRASIDGRVNPKLLAERAQITNDPLLKDTFVKAGELLIKVQTETDVHPAMTKTALVRVFDEVVRPPKQ